MLGSLGAKDGFRTHVKFEEDPSVQVADMGDGGVLLETNYTLPGTPAVRGRDWDRVKARVPEEGWGEGRLGGPVRPIERDSESSGPRCLRGRCQHGVGVGSSSRPLSGSLTVRLGR